jgi:uncharacterized protein
MINKGLHLLTVSILLFTFSLKIGFSQNIPDRPVPPRLVNDLAGILGANVANRLEQKLVAFSDSTSTQIAVVIVPTLGGYDKADYAQQLAEKWGIGQKGLNNGVLVLVKPKTSDSNGQVQISPGYGLEGAIPDITCAEIVDREMIPSFRNGDYYGGIDKATSTLMSLARGEYSAAEYGKKAKKGKGTSFPILVIIFILILIFSKNSGNSNNKHISTGGLPFWLLLGGLNSGRGSSGSWGGFSGGGSSGGGGGFGGFGGGSFGGGGAGGSW